MCNSAYNTLWIGAIGGAIHAAVQEEIPRSDSRWDKDPNHPVVAVPPNAHRPAELHSGVGHIQVKSVTEIDFADLTEADAAADGFETLTELRAELESLYADEIAQGYKTFRIQFALSAEQT